MNEKVRELRKALGLTLEKFGERLGVRKSVLSQIENGKANLTDQMLKSICNVNWDGRRVNEEWLKGNSKEMFKTDPGNELKALAEKYQMSNTEYAFLKEFFKLEPQRREDFFKTLDKVFSAVHTGNVQEAAPDRTQNPKKKALTEINLKGLSNEELGAQVREFFELEEKAEEKSGA